MGKVSDETLRTVTNMIEHGLSHNGTRMGILTALRHSDRLSRSGGITTLDNPTANGRNEIDALNIALAEAGLHFKVSVFKLKGELRWRYTIESTTPSVQQNIPRKRRRVA